MYLLHRYDVVVNRLTTILHFDINRQEPISRWLYEVRGIAEIVQNGDYEECYRRLNVTLDVMEVLEKTRKAAGIYFTGEI